MAARTKEEQKFYENLHPRKVPVSNAVEEPPKKKKGRKKLTVILVIFLVLIGTGAALYFSGVLDPWLNTFRSVKEREDIVEQKEKTLKSDQESLDKKASELDKRESDLDKREQEVKQEETESLSFQDYLSSLSDEDLTRLKKISTIYSKMASKTAAEFISQMSDQNQAAVILYYMPAAASAAIMDVLTPELATQLTAIMAKTTVTSES